MKQPSDIKQRIRQAQTRAVLAVNAELIRLYWEIVQMLDAHLCHKLRHKWVFAEKVVSQPAQHRAD